MSTTPTPNATESQTLADLKPRKAPWLRALGWAGWIVVALVLVASWNFSELDFGHLWAEREKGIEHFFGRDITEEQAAELLAKAEKTASDELQIEAADRVKARLAAEGEVFNDMRHFRLIDAEAEAMEAELGPEGREALVQTRYDELATKARGGYFPLTTDSDKLMFYGRQLVETVAMAVWGTLFAFIFAIPFSLLAARNTLNLLVPGDRWHHRLVRGFGTFCVRRFFDTARGFNEIILGMIFIAIVGLGPFPGVLALAVHTFGILGKVFTDTIEGIEDGQIEGVMATGSGPVQTMAFSVMPQIMPTVVSYSLLRFESNVRSSTILGIVGAGGIGMVLYDRFKGYYFGDVATIMLLVIITVAVIDAGTNRLRRQFI